MKNCTQTVATMQPVGQMKNDIYMPSVWQRLLDIFLTLVMKDKRTEQRYSNAMIWHINSINMLYGQIFQSSFTSFEDFLYGDAKRDTFVIGYNCLVKKDTEYSQD